MGALVRLWIREHRLFIVGTVLVVALLVAVYVRCGIGGASSVAALAVVLGLVHGGLFDTERGAK